MTGAPVPSPKPEKSKESAGVRSVLCVPTAGVCGLVAAAVDVVGVELVLAVPGTVDCPGSDCRIDKADADVSDGSAPLRMGNRSAATRDLGNPSADRFSNSV